MPVERSDGRLMAGAYRAGALMQAALSLLALALMMNLAAALTSYWPLEVFASLAFPLAAMGAVITALAIGLLARARQHLQQVFLARRQPAPRNDWDTGCSHAS